MRRLVVAVLLSLCVALSSPGMAADTTPEAALRDALQSTRAQTEMPGPPTTPSLGPPVVVGDKNAIISAELAQLLLYAALGLFVIVLGAAIWDKVVKRAGPPLGEKTRPVDAAAAAAAGLRMDTARDEADTLAERGDFAGAMHVLLLQGLDEMRRRLKVPLGISLTSREILSRTAMESSARDALADIVSRVEVSWFGSHTPDADEYGACRRSFASLTEALRRSGGAS